MNPSVLSVYHIPELAERVLAHLPELKLGYLFVDEEAKQVATKVYRSNTYWKYRVEILLGYKTNVEFVRWRRLYDGLVKMGLPDKFNMSCGDNDKDIVAFLMEGSGVSLSKSPGIDRSCYEWCGDIISMLLKDPRINITGDFDESIIYEAAFGQEHKVALLLASPSTNLSYGVDRALVAAATTGQSRVVAMLLDDSRLNPSAMTEALIMAVKRRFVDVCLIISHHPSAELALSHADEF